MYVHLVFVGVGERACVQFVGLCPVCVCVCSVGEGACTVRCVAVGGWECAVYTCPCV